MVPARPAVPLPAPPNPAATVSRRARAGRAPWVAPGSLSTAFYVIFLIAPLVLMGYQSLRPQSADGSSTGRIGLGNYRAVFSPTFGKVFRGTVENALLTAVVCAVVGYLTAYWLATRVSARWRPLVLVLVILPFWTSYLLRMIGWSIALSDRGPLIHLLTTLGWQSAHFGVLGTQRAVVIGLLYNNLPLMILPAYVAIERIPRQYREASADLGAHPLTTFRTVTLPMSAPGLLAGSLLVFILSAGDFVTPALLGGVKGLMVGSLISSQVLEGQNLPLGAAMAITLFATLVLIGAVVFGLVSAVRLLRRKPGVAHVS